MCLTISPKVFHQMGRAFAHFVAPKLSLYTVFIDFSGRLNKKNWRKEIVFITLIEELNVL